VSGFQISKGGREVSYEDFCRVVSMSDQQLTKYGSYIETNSDVTLSRKIVGGYFDTLNQCSESKPQIFSSNLADNRRKSSLSPSPIRRSNKVEPEINSYRQSKEHVGSRHIDLVLNPPAGPFNKSETS
jgi:hypothetical protein